MIWHPAGVFWHPNLVLSGTVMTLWPRQVHVGEMAAPREEEHKDFGNLKHNLSKNKA